MRFKFRAQAALELRQREYDEAQRLLARAQVNQRAARAALEETSAAVAGARQRTADAMAVMDAGTPISWYRSWMVRLEHERVTCAHVAASRDAETAQAAAACERTRQRVDALERFRDKARAAWHAALQADEQKQMDALATLRFAGRRSGTQS